MTRPLKLRTFGGTKMTDESAMQKDRTQPSGSAVMQHRHLAEIASIIRDYPGESTTRRLMAEYFADRLEDTNPKFSRTRFLAACVPA